MSAATWWPRYGGKHIVRGYARWYGVDRLCAIAELRMLGVTVTAEYETQVRLAIADIAKARARRAAEKLVASRRPREIEWPADWPVEWIPTTEGDEMGSDEQWF